MREQMLLLKELQETESLIGNLEKENEKLSAEKETFQVAGGPHALSKSMDKLEKEREKLSIQYKRDELLLMSLQTQKKQAENNLYGGTVNSNKEMVQIQGRIQQLQEQIDKQENSMMEVMESQETLEQTIAELGEKYTQMQHELKMKLQENKDTSLRLAQQIKELMVVRNDLRERIQEEILKVYDELKRKKGKAVASLQGDICMRCHVAVPYYIIAGVREAKTFVYCETCGCLLIPE